MNPIMERIGKEKRLIAFSVYTILRDNPGQTPAQVGAACGQGERWARGILSLLVERKLLSRQEAGQSFRYYPTESAAAASSRSKDSGEAAASRSKDSGSAASRSKSAAAASSRNLCAAAAPSRSKDSGEAAASRSKDSGETASSRSKSAAAASSRNLCAAAAPSRSKDSGPRRIGEVLGSSSYRDLINESNRFGNGESNGKTNGAAQPAGEQSNGAAEPASKETNGSYLTRATAQHTEHLRPDLHALILEAEDKLGETGGSRDFYAKVLFTLDRHSALPIWFRALGNALEVPKADIRKTRGALFNALLHRIAATQHIDLRTGANGAG